MLEIPSNVKQELLKLVPSSLANGTACFAFYDHHPSDPRCIDLTICTKNAELKELYQREIVSSIVLNTTAKPSEVIIHRNSKSELFYIVLASDELFVVKFTSKHQELRVLHKLTNVERYSFDDIGCKGEPYLHVISKDDAVPIVFDEDFKHYADRIHNLSVSADKGNVPLETNMSVKCTLARYNKDLTEKSLADMKNLRHLAGYMLYKSIHPNLSTSLFSSGLKEIAGALGIITDSPWVKTCNQKIVMVINICNEKLETLEEIEVLLHGSKEHSMTYTTKLFQSLEYPPFWKEVKVQNIAHKASLALAVVVEMKELKGFTASKIQFNGVIMYKMGNKVKLLPFEEVSISFMETMGEKFDVFFNAQFDKSDMLAVLATSTRTDLVLRQISHALSEVTNIEDISDLLCTHINMETVTEDSNMVVHRKSPYHALNGVMVVFNKREGYSTAAAVYSRNTNQVLSLISYIYDAVPEKIIITTPSHRISTTSLGTLLPPELQRLNAEESTIPQSERLMSYGSSLLKQMSTLLVYYDRCMIKMNESRNELVVSKIGCEIDVFACGVEKFVGLKTRLSEDMMQGMLLDVGSCKDNGDSESMVIECNE